jgi:hypothetical protein
MKTKLMVFLIVAFMPITLLIACNSGKKSNAKKSVEKEFYSGGLKYETRVKMSVAADGKVTGTVKSNEYGVDGDAVSFSGTFTNGEIQVIFDGEPPVIGSNSNWTDKPWRIEVREGEEVLIIPFYAKNYETNEWEDMEYEFEAAEVQETESEGTMALRLLQENETLCYEDETRRVSGSWEDGYDAFIIRVEAKREDVKSFTIQDATAFECVVGNALVLSNGTSNVRMLDIYDLNTGNELLSIEENFMGNVILDDNQTGFTFYRYSEDMPTVRWDADASDWQEVTDVPNELFNADFEKTVQEVSSNLFNGMRLAALQKVHVSIKTKKVRYLNEYKWNYIE